MSESAYPLNEHDATIVARALIHMNNYLVGEYEKIALAGEDVSDLLKEAARQQYTELSTELSKVHVDLANHFPSLRQPTA